ncbi:hypothetical protein SAMN05421878_11120 [Actinobaculum suis]|uniref:Uncharacterized protein n=1 Tax=Actinobaculum suis TaxID=1657 RepID=A0A1G7DI49_9ACTO|nr:hypothetical protein SAMN05421878_11120 [Actinobaculum suis]
MWHRPGYVPGEPVTTHVAELVWEPLLARLIPARAAKHCSRGADFAARAPANLPFLICQKID